MKRNTDAGRSAAGVEALPKRKGGAIGAQKVLGIACGALAVVTVASVLWALSARGEAQRLALELERQKALAAKTKEPKAEPKPEKDRGEASRLDALRDSLERAQREIARLIRENDELRALAAKGGAAPTGGATGTSTDGAKPIPGGPGFAMADAAPTAGPMDPGSIPPPIVAPPPAPRTEPWGASSDGEMDELKQALQLSDEQSEEVRKLIMDGQNEFEQRLIEAGQRGIRDIAIIEEIGQEVSKKTEQRIQQLLFPEQRTRFEEYMRRLRGEDGGN